MKTIKIEINDSIYEHILFFLKNLPKNLIKISYEKEPQNNEDKHLKEELKDVFSAYNIEAFSEMKDPVSWQKGIRDEWE